MKCIGIDPGTKKSAWVVLADDLNSAQDVIIGRRVVDHGYYDNAELLKLIRVLDENDYHGVAVETVRSQGRKVGNETFETCELAGRFIEAAYPQRAIGITRRQVTGHLLGASGGDSMVRKALLDYPNLDPGGVTDHCWQALAVAITYADKWPSLDPGIVADVTIKGASR